MVLKYISVLAEFLRKMMTSLDGYEQEAILYLCQDFVALVSRTPPKTCQHLPKSLCAPRTSREEEGQQPVHRYCT